MTTTSKLIILGSSRSRGDTYQMVDYLMQNGNFDLLDLNTKKISYYDYDYKNQDDDFVPTMKNIVAKYDTLIFATPVYWYSMSAVMKTFFDRISDLLRIHKPIGRQLRGKKMAMLSCSNEDDRVAHFEMPFVESASYLGMEFLGEIHTWKEGEAIAEEAKQRLDEFIKMLK